MDHAHVEGYFFALEVLPLEAVLSAPLPYSFVTRDPCYKIEYTKSL